MCSVNCTGKIHFLWVLSSIWLEQAAHNGLVIGSSPIGPTTFSHRNNVSGEFNGCLSVYLCNEKPF